MNRPPFYMHKQNISLFHHNENSNYFILLRMYNNIQYHSSCSDGVGRTVTFLCIHSQIERLKAEGVVDFLQSIKSAGLQRPGLVADDVSCYPLHLSTNVYTYNVSLLLFF